MKSFERCQVTLGLILILTLLPISASAFRWHRGDRDEARERKISRSAKETRRASSRRAARFESRRAAHRERRDEIRKKLCASLVERASNPRSDHHARALKLFQMLLRCEMFEPEPIPVPDPEPTFPQADAPEITLVDEAGNRVGDLGGVDVDDSIIEVPAKSAFVDPVVILGPATTRDAEPGVPQLDAVEKDAFRVRFKEWSYLDGSHGKETIPYLILEPGRYRFADGSEWEVGKLEVPEAGAFVSGTFASPFDVPPSLFLTVQSKNEDEPVVVRARDVTENGFQVTLMEEEGADGVHAAEQVGYLAVRSRVGSGRLASETSPQPYLVGKIDVGTDSLPVLSGSLRLEEEASVDAELDHADEKTSFLAVGPQVFANAMTFVGTDPVTVRRKAPPQDAGLEWGTVGGVAERWRTVPFARAYKDPVVVAGPVSRGGIDGGVIRMRNVGADGVEMRFQEWAYLDGSHSPERVFYMVAERGIQGVGGLMIEAGSLESSLDLREGMEDVTFAAPFADVPAVFASVTTENDVQPVGVRISDRTPKGFRLAMQEEEASVVGRGLERLGWIAIQRGEGVTPDGRTVRVFDTGANDRVTTVPLGAGLRGRFPLVLGQIVSLVGTDPVVLRYQDLTADSIGLVVEEERSFDAEVGHAVEDVSVFVAE